VLRVAEQYAVTDTGRQRRANEDSLLARSPLFVVADGMGGAQAGEVASRIAVESFQPGLEDGSEPESALAELARTANSRIHELSHANAEQAGMGTTLTAVYVGEDEVAIAHVGDSRAYCLREGALLRLTDDHSLVDELMRQGRLTPEEAVEHPQRSVITRALGPEGTVEVDTRSYRARAGDVYLLCSDGLTTMLSEEDILALLLANPSLRDAGEALIAAANDAGGRDNITVVLLRLEDVQHAATESADELAANEHATDQHATDQDATGEHQTMVGMPAVSAPVSPRAPRRPAGKLPADPSSRAGRRRRLRRAGVAAGVLVVLGLLGSGAYLAMQSVYFIGTNGRGLVTIFRGVPFTLPGNVPLYSRAYVTGVSASTVTPDRRRTLLDHSLRSESSAASLVRSLELGQLE
jgi:serine/threonine protein phosphatase PrpC